MNFVRLLDLHESTPLVFLMGLLYHEKINLYQEKNIMHPEMLITSLKAIWLATDQMCSKRLKAALPLWLPHFDRIYGLEEDIKQKLLKMSARTIDRLLCPVKSKYHKRFCGTKPGSLLRKQIPIKTNQWNETIPGFVEADTVAHCGASLLGNFVWSITLTDIYSGWTENAAVWNKGDNAHVEQKNWTHVRQLFGYYRFQDPQLVTLMT